VINKQHFEQREQEKQQLLAQKQQIEQQISSSQILNQIEECKLTLANWEQNETFLKEREKLSFEEQENTKKALESAKGILRSEVGKNITARLTPTLTFVPDEVPVNAYHLEDLLKKTRERDAELAAASAGAQYAGEADPYKKPEQAEVEED